MNHLTFLIRALFCNMEIPRILQSFCKESQKTSSSVPVLPGWAGGGPWFGQPQAQRDPGEASRAPQRPQPHPNPHLPGQTAKVLLQNSLLCLSKGTACLTSDPHSGSFRGGRGGQQRPEVSEPVCPMDLHPQGRAVRNAVSILQQSLWVTEPVTWCLTSSHIQNTSLP